jgi:hypothetical protein
MIEVIALKRQIVGSKAIAVGDRFSVAPAMAAALTKLRRVALADAPAEPVRAKRTYRRRDMSAA